MDNRRMILLAALAGVVFLIWQAWQQNHPKQPSPQPQTQAQTRSKTGVPAHGTEKNRASAKPTPPAIQQPESGGKSSGKTREKSAAGGGSNHKVQEVRTGATITVKTDRVMAKISTRGGNLVHLKLLKYAVSKDHPNQTLELLNTKEQYFFIAQSGLTARNAQVPEASSRFQAEKKLYQLADGTDTLVVPLTWHGSNGRKVTKTYIFHRDSYQIELKQKVSNGKRASPWQVGQYIQFWRTPDKASHNPRFLHAFMGVSMYQKKKKSDDYSFEQFDFDDLDDNPVNRVQPGGWIAMAQHYFLAAAIPQKKGRVRYYAKPRELPGGQKKAYIAGFVGQQEKLAPGARRTFNTKLFIGPKLQNTLPNVAPGLDLTVDYSYFTVIARPVFWVMSKIHSVVGNWGWTIVLVTLLIRLAFFKLTETQYRSMARMKKFGPRMKQIKERFSDDREKMQKAMMDLYKKEGFNPLGGCWPMIVQFPVFIALYWVLRNSVELRQAPWILWIHNLAAPDPYYILPVLYGVSMFFQQKMSGNSMAMDEMQRKMMMFMPFGLAIFFTFFPAGLVLYWVVSNLISITQQWFIYRRIDSAPAKK